MNCFTAFLRSFEEGWPERIIVLCRAGRRLKRKEDRYVVNGSYAQNDEAGTKPFCS